MIPMAAHLQHLAFIALLTASTSSHAASQISDYVSMALSGAVAEGPLGGKMATDISNVTHSTEQVVVRVRKISSLADDCGRLALLVRQRVPTTDGRQAEWAQEMELNICENGQPPSSGADLRQSPPSVRLLGN